MITNAIKGPRLSDTSQITSMLAALNSNEMKSALRGPSLSAPKPQMSRPTAEEKLKPATRPVPAPDDRPREELYSGRKNGGTKRGKVATAPAMKRVVKLMSRNKCLQIVSMTTGGHRQLLADHSMNVAVLIGERSLISHAAGSPVASIMKPKILKVHAGPRFWIKLFMTKLMTVPPRPPQAYTIPLARPRFLLKYWAGVTDIT